MKINRSFYLRHDVVMIARDLLGKYLATNLDGGITGGYIIETEAYEGVTDRASHAYGNRRTARTEIMYNRGGCAYVYLCYGIHSLFNIVTHEEGTPHAVLIRGLLPARGLEIMCRRTGKPLIDSRSGSGPGRVSSLLGIHYSHTGLDLLGRQIWLEDHGIQIPDEQIITGRRIGVDYAGEDAFLPYRFRLDPQWLAGKQ